MWPSEAQDLKMFSGKMSISLPPCLTCSAFLSSPSGTKGEPSNSEGCLNVFPLFLFIFSASCSLNCDQSWNSFFFLIN